MKSVSAFKKWSIQTDIQNLIRIHERKEKEMMESNLENYQMQIFKGKIYVYKIKKIKRVQ
jgi:hypothetical protein